MRTNEERHSVWIINDEEKTLTMYFPERFIRKLAEKFIHSGLTQDKFLDILMDDIAQMVDISNATTSRQLYEYIPDIKILKDEDFNTLQPTENQTEVDVSISIKKPKGA